MIEIHYDDREVLAALQALERRAGNLRPALAEIGEHLTETTKQRFSSRSGPDGRAWRPNRPVTVERKGRNYPLTHRGTLGQTINYRLRGRDTLEVGSPMEYAAMQQFGGTRTEFPHLWGDIPARPFLGVSEDDKREILDILVDYLELKT